METSAQSQAFFKRLRSQKLSPKPDCCLYTTPPIDPNIGPVLNVHYRPDGSVITNLCTHTGDSCSYTHELWYFLISLFTCGILEFERFKNILTTSEGIQNSNNVQQSVMQAYYLGLLQQVGFEFGNTQDPVSWFKQNGWSNYLRTLLTSNPNDWKLAIHDESSWPKKMIVNVVNMFWNPNSLNKRSYSSKIFDVREAKTCSTSTQQPENQDMDTQACHHKTSYVSAKMPPALATVGLKGCCLPMDEKFDLISFMKDKIEFGIIQDLFQSEAAGNRIKMWYSDIYNPLAICIARKPLTGSKVQFTHLDFDSDGANMILCFLKWYGDVSSIFHARFLTNACLLRLAESQGTKTPPKCNDCTHKYQMNYSNGSFPAMLRIIKNDGSLLNMNFKKDVPLLIFFYISVWVDQGLDKKALEDMLTLVKSCQTVDELQQLVITK